MKQKFLSILVLIIQTACAPVSFESLPLKETPTDTQPPIGNETLVLLNEKSFKISNTQTTVFQSQFEKNKTSLSFSVQKKDGTFLNDLTKQDFRLMEKSGEVKHFSLDSNSQKIVQPVDIVFVFDISGSMRPTVEAAKSRVRDFIYEIRSRKIHTRFCLVTFGDHTIDRCTQFANNDPNDSSTLLEVESFIQKINNLKTPTGADDYGGTDWDENQLRALIDASKSPWLPQSQRFALLVTDATFHYAPWNKGDSGNDAPTYDEALNALTTAQMSVFAAAPKADGYNKSFDKKPSLVDASGGLFFYYNDLLEEKISLTTILTKIIERIKTTYVVDYYVEDNFGWQNNFPLKEREVQVQVAKSDSFDIVHLSVSSSWPEGHPQYQTKWTLSEKKIDPNSVAITVNDQVSNLRYVVSDRVIEFIDLPPPGAKIQIRYRFSQAKDNYLLTAVGFTKEAVLRNVVVYINDKEARKEHLVFKSTNKEWLLNLTEEAFDDPYYQISPKEEVKIQVLEKRNK